MAVTEIQASPNATNVAMHWDDAHRYTPAPRHRRRLVLDMLRHLDFADCLDAGCAQPFLLEEIVQRYQVKGFGCDIADQVIQANQEVLPSCEFRVLDLTRETWPLGRQFDLVLCSEVLEHLPDWKAAVANLVHMTRKHLLITVPSGSIRVMDRLVGHFQHFQGPELCMALQENGWEVEHMRHWGYPVHSLYKILISALSPRQVYNAFSRGKPYGRGKKWLSQMLYLLFFVNDWFYSGYQLFIYARRIR